MPAPRRRCRTTPLPPARARRPAATSVVALGLLVVAAGVRLAGLALPGLAAPNYEEALVGLMARHILLAGDFVTFWWGHPYLGTADVYLTAALFGWLAPVTPVLRLAPLLLSLVAAAASYRLALALWGPGAALVALAWWAVPPAFLLRLSLTPYEYTGGVALGSVILYLTYRGVAAERARPALWLVLGITWGLAIWDHLVAACYVAASAAAIGLRAWAYARPAGRRAALRAVATDSAYGWCAVGFLIGNLPFWIWNLVHWGETLSEVAVPAVQARAGGLEPARHLVAVLLPELLGRAQYFWSGPIAGPAWMWAIALLYLPVLGYTLAALVAPGGRTDDRRRLGVRVVALCFVLACVQVVFSHYHLSRYLMPIYAAVPILVAGYARWLWGRARPLAVATIAGILILHAADDARLYAGHRQPGTARPADALVGFLREMEIGHVYAHFRVAWPLAFESGERIVASDFDAAEGFLAGKSGRGPRSGVYVRPYFAMLDAVDLAPRVALVTHEGLRLPTAGQLAASLTLLGAAYERMPIGDYTVFYDFRPPVGAVREIPPGAMRVRASDAGEQAAWAVDRNISTAWSTGRPQEAGMFVEVELDRPRRLARLVLDPGDWPQAFPRGLRIEVSEDGHAWRVVLEAADHHRGIDWLGGHPKLNARGKLGIWMSPVPARLVRVSLDLPRAGREPWAIAELFLYEEAGAEPPGAGGGLADEDGRRVLATLAAEGIRGIYSFDEANVFFTSRRPRGVKTISLRDPRPLDESERVVRFDRPRAFFLRTASPGLEARLAQHGVPVTRRALAGGVLYVTAPRRGVAPLYWDHEQLLSLGLPP